jgi:hypothetical protein
MKSVVEVERSKDFHYPEGIGEAANGEKFPPGELKTKQVQNNRRPVMEKVRQALLLLRRKGEP